MNDGDHGHNAPTRRISAAFDTAPAAILPVKTVTKTVPYGTDSLRASGSIRPIHKDLFDYDPVFGPRRLLQSGRGRRIDPVEGRGCGFARDRLAVALPDGDPHGAVEQARCGPADSGLALLHFLRAILVFRWLGLNAMIRIAIGE